jgi:hypothetical protein
MRYSLDNLVLTSAHLRRCIAVAKGDGTVLHGLEVNCDTEWGAQFIVTRVPLAWELLDSCFLSMYG